MVEATNPLILEAEHLSKRFGAVSALTDVSMRLHRGEVLGLVGDNGAGKSTLTRFSAASTSLIAAHTPSTASRSN